MFGNEGRHLNFNLAGANGHGLRAIFEGGTTRDGEAPLLVTAMEDGPSPNGIIGLNEAKDLASSEFARLKLILEEGVIRPKGKDLRERPLGINAFFIMGQYGEELFSGKTEEEIDAIMAGMTKKKMIEILQRGSADGRTGAMPYALIQRAVASGDLIMLRPVPQKQYSKIVGGKTAEIVRNMKNTNDIDLRVEASLLEFAGSLAKNNQGTRALDSIIKSLTETAVSEAFDLGLPMRGLSVRLSYAANERAVVVEAMQGDKATSRYAIDVNRLVTIDCETLLK
jgi:hypothetical protein